jgi:hypothetical protein
MSIDSRDAWSTTSRPPTLITSREDLKSHLQWAIELEHTTIPPYLCALYSLDAAQNPDAAEVAHIGSVFADPSSSTTAARSSLSPTS